MSEFSFNVDSLIRTNLILSALSFIGSLTIIILFICRKTLRSFVFTLTFFLSISELLNSTGNLLSIDKLMPEQSIIICKIQSVLINYTDICSLLWMCIISYTIHNLMTKFCQEFGKRKIVFLVIGFGLPLIFTILQSFLYFNERDKLNRSDNIIVPDCWCWMGAMEENKWAVVGIYIVYWILIIGNFILILKTISFLKSNCHMEDKNSKKIRKMINKLYLYPILSGFCFLFATIHRMYQLFLIRDPNIELTEELIRLEVIFYLFHGIFISFRGFLFVLIYGFDNKVLNEFKILFNKFYSFICKRKLKKSSESFLTQDTKNNL